MKYRPGSLNEWLEKKIAENNENDIVYFKLIRRLLDSYKIITLGEEEEE